MKTSSFELPGTQLVIEPLAREAFRGFGDVIETKGARQIPINQGNTLRFHDLAKIDVGEGARVLVNLFRGQPRTLPFEIRMMERHPYGSQAFIPVSNNPYLIVVAPAGAFDPSQIRAFVSQGWQGVNYAPGVWHHPLLALDEVSDFVVIDRDGSNDPKNNCEEEQLPQSLWLTQAALYNLSPSRRNTP